MPTAVRALVVLVVAFLTPTVAPAQKVKVLLIGDTADKQIGEAVKGDLLAFKSLVVSNIDQNLYDIRRIETDDPAAIPGKFGGTVLKEIETCGVGPKDTLVVYYSGHGEYDPKLKDYADGMLFSLSGGPHPRGVSRADVRAAMAKTKARLCVLISDCCYVDPGRIKNVAKSAPKNASGKLFDKLLFGHEGWVDVTSSSIDQFSLAMRDTSLFTLTLKDVLEANKENGALGWKDVFEKAREDAETTFRKRYTDDRGQFTGWKTGLKGTDGREIVQMAHTAHWFGLYDDVRAVGKPNPVGVAGITFVQYLRVQQVVKGSPAERAGLKADDFVVGLGNRRFETANPEKEYGDLIDNTKDKLGDMQFLQGGKPRTETDIVLAAKAPRFGAQLLNQPGVAVWAVEWDSPFRGKLHEGDLITKVNGRVVRTSAEALAALGQGPDDAEFEYKSGSKQGTLKFKLNRPKK